MGDNPVSGAPGDVAIDPATATFYVSNAATNTVSAVREHRGSAPVESPPGDPHPLIGAVLPDFTLPDLHTGALRSTRDWAEKKYILNFFASW